MPSFPLTLVQYCWVLLVAFLLSACVAPFRDADIDLRELTQPDPLPAPPSPAPPSSLSAPVRPPSAPTIWRAWVPRQVTPNGDVTTGHWLDVSTQEPVVERLEPEKPMPRAPRSSMPKATSPLPATLAPPPPSPPPPPASGPVYWPSTGMPPPRDLPPGLRGGE